MEQKVILPLPEDPRFDIRDYQVSEVPCGFVVVELVCVAGPHHPQQSLGGKKKKVSHYIRYLLGAMLPWHILGSLSSEGFRPTPIEYGHSSQILEALNNGCPVVVFLGCGIGHWVVLWGYDERNFYMFDNRAHIARDEFGVSRMDFDKFYSQWAKIPFFLKPLQWLGKYFQTLRLKPRTMIIPW